MKKVFLLIIFFVIFKCANIYSPLGISGKEAKKQIEEIEQTAFLVSIPSLLGRSSSNSSIVCPTDINSILGSNTNTVSANFNFPGEGSYVDLNATSGSNLYFRTAAASETVQLSGKILQTASTKLTAECRYNASAAACGTSDISGLTLSYISTSIFVSAGHCLAVRCAEPGYLRFQKYNMNSVFNSTSLSLSPLLNLALGPSVAEVLSAIEDNKYYTQESFDKCKKSVMNQSFVQLFSTNESLSEAFEVLSCNKPATPSNSAAIAMASYVIQGNECKLEPVNVVGF
ncbi:small lipoprotein [Leptospira sp. 96542]|nr:small lipoprotein [Leptospira sp. 96542]